MENENNNDDIIENTEHSTPKKIYGSLLTKDISIIYNSLLAKSLIMCLAMDEPIIKVQDKDEIINIIKQRVPLDLEKVIDLPSELLIAFHIFERKNKFNWGYMSDKNNKFNEEINISEFMENPEHLTKLKLLSDSAYNRKPTNEELKNYADDIANSKESAEISKCYYVNFCQNLKFIHHFRIIFLKCLIKKSILGCHIFPKSALDIGLSFDNLNIISDLKFTGCVYGSWRLENVNILLEKDKLFKDDPRSNELFKDQTLLTGTLTLTNVGSRNITSDIDISSKFEVKEVYQGWDEITSKILKERSNYDSESIINLLKNIKEKYKDEETMKICNESLMAAKIQTGVIYIFNSNVNNWCSLLSNPLPVIFDINFYNELPNDGIELMQLTPINDLKYYRRTNRFLMFLDFYYELNETIQEIKVLVEKDPSCSLKNLYNLLVTQTTNLKDQIISHSKNQFRWPTVKRFLQETLINQDSELAVGSIDVYETVGIEDLKGYYLRNRNKDHINERLNQFVKKLKDITITKTIIELLLNQQGTSYYALEAFLGDDVVIKMILMQLKDNLKAWYRRVNDPKSNIKELLKDDTANPNGETNKRLVALENYINSLDVMNNIFLIHNFVIQNLVMAAQHYLMYRIKCKNVHNPEDIIYLETAAVKLGKYVSRVFIEIKENEQFILKSCYFVILTIKFLNLLKSDILYGKYLISLPTRKLAAYNADDYYKVIMGQLPYAEINNYLLGDFKIVFTCYFNPIFLQNCGDDLEKIVENIDTFVCKLIELVKELEGEDWKDDGSEIEPIAIFEKIVDFKNK